MKKPTLSTVTPSDSDLVSDIKPEPVKVAPVTDWASDLTIVYFVGLAAGVKEGFIPAFGEKKITKGEWDYKAVRVGDILTVTKEINFWNRQSVATSLASANDNLNKARHQLESARVQRDGAAHALEKSRAKLDFVRDEDRKKEEDVLLSWELTLEEHSATYDRMEAKFKDAEAEVKRLQSVTFPDATQFVIDLNKVTLA